MPMANLSAPVVWRKIVQVIRRGVRLTVDDVVDAGSAELSPEQRVAEDMHCMLEGAQLYFLRKASEQSELGLAMLMANLSVPVMWREITR